MLSLIYDTETTGKYNYRLTPLDPSQPDVLQICAILCDEARVYAQMNVFVHGEDPVPQEAFEIHRIDRDMTARVGITRARACLLFDAMAQKADVLVGHNQDFDNAIMRSAMLREKGSGRIMNKSSYCTMKSATEICKLPKTNGKPGYKWPSLQEAFRLLVDPRGFEGAHDALVDVTATREVYRVLRQNAH